MPKRPTDGLTKHHTRSEHFLRYASTNMLCSVMPSVSSVRLFEAHAAVPDAARGDAARSATAAAPQTVAASPRWRRDAYRPTAENATRDRVHTQRRTAAVARGPSPGGITQQGNTE